MVVKMALKRKGRCGIFTALRRKRGVAQPGLARQLGVLKVVGSNPATPTIFRKKPFGEYVEGLSHCGDEVYAIET